MSKQIFDRHEWSDGYSRQKKFDPHKQKVAELDDPAELVTAAYGVEPNASEDLAAKVASIEALDTRIQGLVGKAAVIKSAGWRDPSQSMIRLFSPRVRENESSPIRYSAWTRVAAESQGFYGWDTFMSIDAVADVHDIWYGDIEMTYTSIQIPLFQTYRNLGSRVVRGEVVHPIEQIEIIDNPEEIQRIANEEYEIAGKELLQLLYARLEKLEPATVS